MEPSLAPLRASPVWGQLLVFCNLYGGSTLTGSLVQMCIALGVCRISLHCIVQFPRQGAEAGPVPNSYLHCCVRPN